MQNENITSWGDIEESESDLTGTKVIETEPDENGVTIRTVVEYSTNDKGQKIKTTKNYKIYKKKTRVNKNMLERKKWQKFGDAKPGEQGVTYFGEPVEIITKASKKEKEDVDLLVDVEKKDMWRSRAERLGARSWDDITRTADGRKDDEKSERKDLYVPKHLQKGAKDDNCTVRVTNLSEDVIERDVWDLFRIFGSIQRVYLAKDKKTGLSKGFAFVTYLYREDAVRAIENLDGHGYAHLILSVEWARPSSDAYGR